MAGRDDEADAPLERLGELARDLRMPNIVDAVTATTVVRSMLAGSTPSSPASSAPSSRPGDIPAGPVATVIALRPARSSWPRYTSGWGSTWRGTRSWPCSTRAWRSRSRSAWTTRSSRARGDPLALPYAGRMCSAGTAAPVGPVDAFLARGAMAMGDDEAATAHAAAAVALARGRLPRWSRTWPSFAQRYAR